MSTVYCSGQPQAKVIASVYVQPVAPQKGCSVPVGIAKLPRWQQADVTVISSLLLRTYY